MKKFISLVVCLTLGIPLVACQPKDPQATGSDPRLEFWSTYASEKVLADESITSYADVKKEAVIEAAGGDPMSA